MRRAEFVQHAAIHVLGLQDPAPSKGDGVELVLDVVDKLADAVCKRAPFDDDVLVDADATGRGPFGNASVWDLKVLLEMIDEWDEHAGSHRARTSNEQQLLDARAKFGKSTVSTGARR